MYNTTGDAHPMHIHEIVFEVVNREGLVLDEDDEVVQPIQLDGNVTPGGAVGIGLQGHGHRLPGPGHPGQGTVQDARPVRLALPHRRARGQRDDAALPAGILRLMERELAIRLRGVVKRYGPITAVDGLDLEVPVGTCVGLLGPNGAGKSTTMRLLTAQSIADEGEIEVLGFRLPDESKQARAPVRRRPAARQPRHDADRRAEPARLRAPLPDRPRRATRGDRARARDGEARRPARLAGRQALGRHAPAPADRARARASAAPRAARRADRRPRPAGAPGAVGADRRAALRGDDDPDVDALHRGGAAPRRHGADHVAREGRRGRPARGARARARRPARRSRSTARPRGSPRSRREAGAAGLRTRRTGTSVSILGVDGANGSPSTASGAPANLEDVFVLLTGEEIA